MRTKLGNLFLLCFAIALILPSLSIYLPASTTLSTSTDPELPVYQPIWERKPELFDQESLAMFREEHPAIDLKMLEQSVTEDVIVDFKGFIGPYYTTHLNGSVKVLENTISINTMDGYWTAAGLIRNETKMIVGNATVIATLKDREGHILEEIEAPILVSEIRSGEPAPFMIKSNTHMDDVHGVDWVVKGHPPTLASREFIIYKNWELAYGEEYHNYTRRNDAPYPYVLSTSAENLGRDVKSAKIVIGWLDDSGKIAWIEESKIDSNHFANGITRDGVGNFENISVSDPGIGPMLNQYQYMMWVVGE